MKIFTWFHVDHRVGVFGGGGDGHLRRGRGGDFRLFLDRIWKIVI